MKQRNEFLIYRELEEIIAEMGDYVDAAIVEGAHDKKTLEKMGFTKDILKYSGTGMSDTDFIDLIARKYHTPLLS